MEPGARYCVTKSEGVGFPSSRQPTHTNTHWTHTRHLCVSLTAATVEGLWLPGRQVADFFT